MRGGDIENRYVAKSDHISHEAVDIKLTTLVKVESGLDMCRSAGFQSGAVISIIGRFSISDLSGLAFKEEVRSCREQWCKHVVEINHKWLVRIPMIIANTVPV